MLWFIVSKKPKTVGNKSWSELTEQTVRDVGNLVLQALQKRYSVKVLKFELEITFFSRESDAF